MTGIEKKAEEYVKDFRMKHNFVIGDYCTYFNFREAYKDGYEQGQKETMSYKDNYIKDLDVIIDTFKKENEELKNFIDENENREKELCILCENLKAQLLGLQNNLEGQKARKNHLFKENAKLTSELAKLKAQIEKMKCCYNCKNLTNYELCGYINKLCEKWELAE